MEGELITKGRPLLYEPWMCGAIIEVAKDGGHIAAMCIRIGIKSEDTFHRWKREIPEFAEAYSESKLYAKALHENIFWKGCTGQIPGFQVTGYLALLHNKFKEEWKRDGSGGMEINITNNTLSLEQLDSKIAQTQEVLQRAGCILISNDDD